MPRNRLAQLHEANTKAQAFAADYLKAHALDLPPHLTDEEFDKAMRAALRSLVQAWAAGYVAGAKL